MIINILKNYNELKLEELLAEPRQGLSGARSYLAEEVCSLDEGCWQATHMLQFYTKLCWLIVASPLHYLAYVQVKC